MTEIRTLRPGLLVSLSVRTQGNVQYRRKDIEEVHDETGEERSVWETERIITDPEEHAAARKVASKASSLIRGVCATSAFGLLCPEDDADKLTSAIDEARALAEEFNDGAGLTRISINVLYGRIAQDDVQAVKAITSELRTLMEDMQDGLRNLDVQVVRDAASKAKSLGEMLGEDAKARLDVAIEAARKSARKIVRAATDAADVAAIEIDKATIAKIDMARTSFLDIEGDGEVATPEQSAAPTLDFTDDDDQKEAS